MKTKVIVVKSVEDLEKIRKVEEDSRVIIILMEDIDFVDPIEYFSGNYIESGKPKFTPISKRGLSVIFYGNGHTISNLNVNTNYSDCAGLFSKVDNLYIRNTRFYQAKVKGRDSIGVIAGEVNGKANIKNTEIIGGDVEGKLYVGGMVGFAYSMTISDSSVTTQLKADDLYGAVVGTAMDSFSSKNVDATAWESSEGIGPVIEHNNLCGLTRSDKNMKKVRKQ